MFWHALAWAGAFVVTMLVLVLGLVSRWLIARGRISRMNDRHDP